MGKYLWFKDKGKIVKKLFKDANDPKINLETGEPGWKGAPYIMTRMNTKSLDGINTKFYSKDSIFGTPPTWVKIDGRWYMCRTHLLTKKVFTSKKKLLKSLKDD